MFYANSEINVDCCLVGFKESAILKGEINDRIVIFTIFTGTKTSRHENIINHLFDYDSS